MTEPTLPTNAKILARKTIKLLGCHRSKGADAYSQARLDELDLGIYATHGIEGFTGHRNTFQDEVDAA